MTTDHTLPLSTLTALSPLDGRYRTHTAALATYLSEYSLIRVRLEMECAYLAALAKHQVIRTLTPQEEKLLEELGPRLTLEDATEIKRIEQTLNHDVKAVEVFFREKVTGTSLEDVIEFIHFGITSEDINNLSYRLMLKRATENVLLPEIKTIIDVLSSLATDHAKTAMLGRTHGQPAVGTTLGKELSVFAYRLALAYHSLRNTTFSGKVAGALGNYNALSFSFPETDWIAFADDVVTSLGLRPVPSVTQINTYEDIIIYFQCIQRINNILLDFNQDMWRYISDGWFVQHVEKNEVGSSTMPQKVNPIYFENAEGNIGLANTLCEYFVRKLPISRLQRDLSDSTVIRNFASALSYSLLAYKNTQTGISRVKPDRRVLDEALDSDWSILSEAAQTVLRKEGVTDPYSLLKSLTRGEEIDEKRWKDIIQKLPVSEETKRSLTSLSPHTYIGKAPEVTLKTLKVIQEIIQ